MVSNCTYYFSTCIFLYSLWALSILIHLPHIYGTAIHIMLFINFNCLKVFYCMKMPQLTYLWFNWLLRSKLFSLQKKCFSEDFCHFFSHVYVLGSQISGLEGWTSCKSDQVIFQNGCTSYTLTFMLRVRASVSPHLPQHLVFSDLKKYSNQWVWNISSTFLFAFPWLIIIQFLLPIWAYSSMNYVWCLFSYWVVVV